MDFQRSRSRRRRIFREDSVGATDTAVVETSASDFADSTANSGRTYTSGARKRCQLRTTDLVPIRPIPFTLVATILVLAAIGLTVLYCCTINWKENVSNQLTLAGNSGPGLIEWFSNLTLILSAAGCLQIYALRRHRCDDYQGSYRLWGWMAAGLILASAFCVTNIDLFVGYITRDSLGFGFLTHGSLFWLAFKLILIVSIAARVIIDTKQSKGASITIGLASLIFFASALLNHSWFKNQFIGQTHPIFDTINLWGVVVLALGLLTFARFVYLDAHSLIKRKERSEKTSRLSGIRIPKIKIQLPKLRREVVSSTSGSGAKSSKKKNKSTDSSSKRDSLGSTGTKKKKKPERNSKNTSSQSPHETKDKRDRQSRPSSNPDIIKLSDADQRLLDTDESEVNSLSKSDRRRLRKLQKRVRQAA